MLKNKFIFLLIVLIGTSIPPIVYGNLSEKLLQKNFKLLSSPSELQFDLNSTFNPVNGKRVSLKGKVVIITFWKIDSAPCALQHSILERIYRKHADRDLEVIALNPTDSSARVKPYVRSSGYGFNFLNIQNKQLNQTEKQTNLNSVLGLEVPTYPTTYLINREGRLVGNSVGLVNWEEGPLRELLETLLCEPLPQDGSTDSKIAEAKSSFKKNWASNVQNFPAVEAGTKVARGPRKSGADSASISGENTNPAEQSESRPSVKPKMMDKSIAPSESTQSAGLRKPKPVAMDKSAGQGADTGGNALKDKKPKSANTPVPQVLPPAVESNQITPLPPAQPYYPSASQGLAPLPPTTTSRNPQSTRIVLDDDGRVMAQIPGKVGDQPAYIPPPQAPTNQNAIGGSIMSSFGKPDPIPLTVPKEQPKAVQNSWQSIPGKIGTDIWNFGAGIRDGVSGIFSRRK